MPHKDGSFLLLYSLDLQDFPLAPTIIAGRLVQHINSDENKKGKALVSISNSINRKHS